MDALVVLRWSGAPSIIITLPSWLAYLQTSSRKCPSKKHPCFVMIIKKEILVRPLLEVQTVVADFLALPC